MKTKMNRATAAMTVILLLCAVAAQGIPILDAQGRCHCPRTSSDFINPKIIKNLEYIPKGPHCETQEIIIATKKGQRFCLIPDAEWVKIIIRSRKGSRPRN